MTSRDKRKLKPSGSAPKKKKLEDPAPPVSRAQPHYYFDSDDRPRPFANYIPQFRDDVVYFRRGQETYLALLAESPGYFQPPHPPPYSRRPNFPEALQCTVTHLQYGKFYPKDQDPAARQMLTFMQLTLTPVLGGDPFIIDYAEMVITPDFLVLSRKVKAVQEYLKQHPLEEGSSVHVEYDNVACLGIVARVQRGVLWAPYTLRWPPPSDAADQDHCGWEIIEVQKRCGYQDAVIDRQVRAQLLARYAHFVAQYEGYFLLLEDETEHPIMFATVLERLRNDFYRCPQAFLHELEWLFDTVRRQQRYAGDHVLAESMLTRLLRAVKDILQDVPVPPVEPLPFLPAAGRAPNVPLKCKPEPESPKLKPPPPASSQQPAADTPRSRPQKFTFASRPLSKPPSPSPLQPTVPDGPSTRVPLRPAPPTSPAAEGAGAVESKPKAVQAKAVVKVRPKETGAHSPAPALSAATQTTPSLSDGAALFDEESDGDPPPRRGSPAVATPGPVDTPAKVVPRVRVVPKAEIKGSAEDTVAIARVPKLVVRPNQTPAPSPPPHVVSRVPLRSVPRLEPPPTTSAAAVPIVNPQPPGVTPTTSVVVKAPPAERAAGSTPPSAMLPRMTLGQQDSPFGLPPGGRAATPTPAAPTPPPAPQAPADARRGPAAKPVAAKPPPPPPPPRPLLAPFSVRRPRGGPLRPHVFASADGDGDGEAEVATPAGPQAVPVDTIVAAVTGPSGADAGIESSLGTFQSQPWLCVATVELDVPVAFTLGKEGVSLSPTPTTVCPEVTSTPSLSLETERRRAGHCGLWHRKRLQVGDMDVAVGYRFESIPPSKVCPHHLAVLDVVLGLPCDVPGLSAAPPGCTNPQAPGPSAVAKHPICLAVYVPALMARLLHRGIPHPLRRLHAALHETRRLGMTDLCLQPDPAELLASLSPYNFLADYAFDPAACVFFCGPQQRGKAGQDSGGRLRVVGAEGAVDIRVGLGPAGHS